MGSVQQNPELGIGEKIVKVVGRVIIAGFLVVACVWRGIIKMNKKHGKG